MSLPRWLNALAHLDRLPEVVRCALVFSNFHRLLICYLHLRPWSHPFKLRSRDGYMLEITSYHDAVTAWVIFCREEYGMPKTVQTVVDIGANYGAFSLWVSRHEPNARVVAVEPFPMCYDRLRDHVQTNGLADRVQTWNVALSRDSQDRYLAAQEGTESGIPSQSRAFVGEEHACTTSVKISTLSLNDMMAKACEVLACDEIDFVKMDVEGIEHAAITADAIPGLHRVRNLSLEYHPNGSKATLFNLLANAGLRCTVDLRVSENSGVARFTRGERDPYATASRR